MRKQFLGSLLALTIATMPFAAFADGQLQPLNSNHSSSYGYQDNTPTYTANAYQANASDSMALRGRISTLPKGTTMIVKLDQPLSSYSSDLGESVAATIESDVFVNDQVAIPAGSEVVGQVTDVAPSGRLGKHGQVDVRFHSIRTPGGAVIPIHGHIVTEDETGILRGNSYKMDIAKGIGIAAGGTGVGALAGTALGGILGVAGTGAVMGTGIGALVGMGYAIGRKGKDVVIPSGARLSIKVNEETSF